MKKFVFGVSILGVLSACKKEEGSERPRSSTQESCVLEGTWSRCQNDGGGSSTLVTLDVHGDQIDEVIRNFDSENCTGTIQGSFDLQLSHVLGAQGKSRHIDGGTDITLESDTDIGCGADPMYTVIKFQSSCSEYLAVPEVPSCDPETRGSEFDPLPFVKD